MASVDDQLRKIEIRINALEKEKTELLNELKKLRLIRDHCQSNIQLGHSSASHAPTSNEE